MIKAIIPCLKELLPQSEISSATTLKGVIALFLYKKSDKVN